MNTSTSPSRTYVAMCSKRTFKGYYFQRFTLPEGRGGIILGEVVPYTNDSDTAAWYFLNVLNFEACIDGCVAWEDFTSVKQVLPSGKVMSDMVCQCGRRLA